VIISWNEYYMGIALLTAKRSKDPSTQVGSCIVSPDNRLISVGYNGFPKSQLPVDVDAILPWGKSSENELENKYPYVVHSEPNAILHARESVKGCTMYLTWFPCSDCAKTIAQSGISKLVYLHENTGPRYETSMKAAKFIFEVCGIVYEKYSGSIDELVIKYG
jgi:dCMP deaminase